MEVKIDQIIRIVSYRSFFFHLVPLDFVAQTIDNTENMRLNDPQVYYRLLIKISSENIVQTLIIIIRLLDVGEEGTFIHQGRAIKVSVNTLVDINILGCGNFANVMLAEVIDGPDTIRMAVKVSERFLP